MEKEQQLFFISGLPRSGSSLFCNILNQNPDAYSSPTSGLPQITEPIVQGWDKVAEFKANSSMEQKRSTLRGVFNGYYEDKEDKKYIFDKSRGWPRSIEMLEAVFDKKPKIILCVRDVRDILSSWEKMYRRDKKELKPTPGEQQNPGAFITIKSRCEYWSSSDSPLGSAFNVMRDAIDRGHRDCLYFLEYEKWTHRPAEEFSKLYTWLEIPEYEHNFEDIKQVLKENDEWYGYIDLHNIKEGKLIPSEPQWEKYLNEDLSSFYKGSNIWTSPQES